MTFTKLIVNEETRISMHSAQAIVIRAVLESDYRETLFRNPIRALEGYDLTAMEYMWLY